MCFTPDTKVLMGDQTFKEIVDLKLGDMVQTFDVETGKMVSQKSTRLFTADQDYYYLINAKLKVKVGDKIQSDGVGKAIEITSIEKQDIDYQVYNFRVAEGHNYFISPDRIELYLVHNAKYID
jgi:hypothetical protein